MEKHRFFRNSYGHLRAGWRIFVFLLLIIPSFLPIIFILKLIGWLFPISGGVGLTSPINIIFMIGLSITIVIAAYITLRWVDKRPYELLGLNFSLSSIREFLIGCLIGGVNLISVVLLLSALGFLKISWSGINSVVMQTIGIYTLVFAGGATIEELINRGYIFQALCEGTRTWIAVFVTSLIFSLIHLSNQHMSVSSILHLFIHGILYAVVYLKTRSLWAAIGVHWAWNWFQGAIFGIPVSGTTISNTLFLSHPQGAVIFSGGQFGIEGSILACLISLVFVVFVWRTKWLSPTERMVTLWNQYPDGFRLDPHF
jgi:membrane protease YdiL (CAAX protease family)